MLYHHVLYHVLLTDYVEVIKENIQPGMLRHFDKLTRADVDSLGEEYDYSSIMHFRRDAFAKPGKNEAIRPKQCCPRPVIGEATQPSAGDFRQLEEQSDCSYNHLEIFDGPSESSPILRKLCGLDIPATIRSTSNRVTVRFTTDSVLGSQRFAASFEKEYVPLRFRPCVQCGQKQPQSLISHSSELRVVFHSDGHLERTGFRAAFYTYVNNCTVSNGGCQHICESGIPKHKCKCRSGYKLQNVSECITM
nr:unnamed protein product [Spirometra erinaceieuropaei]